MQNTSNRKARAEVLDMYYSLSHRYLWPFQLCFEHTMAVSWQECHCNNSPHYLALFIKQNPSKLSNLMVLDKNIITTNRGRKAFSYLQKNEAIWRLFIHPDTSKSAKLNFFTSRWNPCTPNVHRITKPDTMLSYTLKRRSAPASEVIYVEEAKGNKNTTCKVQKMGGTWLQRFFAYSVLWSLCRTSTDIKSSSLCGSERKIFAQWWILWYSAVNT